MCGKTGERRAQEGSGFLLSLSCSRLSNSRMLFPVPGGPWPDRADCVFLLADLALRAEKAEIRDVWIATPKGWVKYSMDGEKRGVGIQGSDEEQDRKGRNRETRKNQEQE